MASLITSSSDAGDSGASACGSRASAGGGGGSRSIGGGGGGTGSTGTAFDTSSGGSAGAPTTGCERGAAGRLTQYTLPAIAPRANATISPTRTPAAKSDDDEAADASGASSDKSAPHRHFVTLRGTRRPHPE